VAVFSSSAASGEYAPECVPFVIGDVYEVVYTGDVPTGDVVYFSTGEFFGAVLT
jgi:hypothetical protein